MRKVVFFISMELEKNKVSIVRSVVVISIAGLKRNINDSVLNVIFEAG